VRARYLRSLCIIHHRIFLSVHFEHPRNGRPYPRYRSRHTLRLEFQRHTLRLGFQRHTLRLGFQRHTLRLGFQRRTSQAGFQENPQTSIYASHPPHGINNPISLEEPLQLTCLIRLKQIASAHCIWSTTLNRECHPEHCNNRS
jgi:hypothetical protein